MTLKDRLNQLMGSQATSQGEERAQKKTNSQPAPAADMPGASQLNAQVQTEHNKDAQIRESPIPESPILESIIPGELQTNALGNFWLCTTDYPVTDRHGFRKIDEALAVDPGRLALMTSDARLNSFHPGKVVFLDTETTSVHQGAGVYVFMIGIGFFVDNLFRIEQYFMRDYDEEEAMFHAFNKRMEAHDGMVSFFGKNFDQYRILDRMALLGIDSALPTEIHLDLYHLSRRLYAGRFANLKLKTLETELLGFHRINDIPGAECPEAYFRYIEGHDQGRMAEVFEHNLWDILSLATLCAEVDTLAARPESARDKYVLACAYMKSKEDEMALPLLEEALSGLAKGPEAFDARSRRVQLLKRANQLDALEQELHALVSLAPENPEALTEMAMFYEHKQHDYATAHDFAQRALTSLTRWDMGTPRCLQKKQSAQQRLARLEKKLTISEKPQ